jgi:uncharacterized protein
MSRRIVPLSVALFLMRASIGAAATPAPIEGDWIGGFDGRDGTVFISAHFEMRAGQKGESPSGPILSGEIDLPLRGDRQVPLKNISASDSRVSFEVPGANGNLLFEGRHQNGTVSGSVRQASSSSRFEMIKLAAPAPETIADITGDYELAPGRVILITKSPTGLLYLDQTGNRLGVLYPIAERTFVSGPSVVAGYPVELTVTFDRAANGASPALIWQPKGQAPQRAVRKAFYSTEPVGYQSGSGATGIRLSGSLMLPNGPGPHPAIVMIHGSGAVTREALFPYADVFARNGIAVLLSDKRGTGSSTGNWARATFDDLAGDALAGVNYLQTRPEINARQIGLQGTSLGGWVAPLAASKANGDVAFVIVESAPALTPLEHERLRVKSQMRADGFSPMEIFKATSFMEQKFDVARTGKGWDRLEAAMARAKQEGWHGYVNPPSSLESLQWHWEHVLSYDPQPALERLTCPVLVLYGELDTIVSPSENRKRMETAFARGGHRDATIKVFDKANHGFFAAITGGRREAGALKGLVPGYLDTRVDWLRQRVTVSNAAAVPTDAPDTEDPAEEPSLQGGPKLPVPLL